VNAREDMEQRLLIEARVEAERVLLALGAALAADGALLSAPERADIDSAIGKLGHATQGPDRDHINAAVDALDHATHSFAQRRMDRAVAQALKGHSLDEVEADMATDPAPDRSLTGHPGSTH
jgi:molecular chaperone HscA